MEQPFIKALEANEIEGVILQGRDIRGNTYSKAIGKRTLPDGTTKLLSTTDILFLASATKLLTTIAALQCCEQGLLSLDAALASLLPQVVQLGALVPNAGPDEEPKFEPLRKPLTLRHLITHSSGLVYDFMNPSLQKWRTANPLSKDASDVPTRYLSPLAFQPGEGWTYGVGLDWAGYVVEQVSGMRLDEYFRTHILKPLDISPTEISFFPVKEGLGDRMPDLNPKDVKGSGLSAAMGSDLHGDVLTGCFGGQGGYASSEAYIAILLSITANDGKLLSKQTVAEMFKPQLEPLAKKALTTALSGPFGPWVVQNTADSDRDYGLGGLHVGKGDASGLGTNSITWGGGCNSAWFIDPENGVCGFAGLQLGIPPNIAKAMELKGVFRKEMREQLRRGSSRM